MKNYHFCECISDEEFLVGADTYAEAYAIAVDIAKEIGNQQNDGRYDLEYYGTMSDFWAECSGLDEY